MGDVQVAKNNEVSVLRLNVHVLTRVNEIEANVWKAHAYLVSWATFNTYVHGQPFIHYLYFDYALIHRLNANMADLSDCPGLVTRKRG